MNNQNTNLKQFSRVGKIFPKSHENSTKDIAKNNDTMLAAQSKSNNLNG